MSIQAQLGSLLRDGYTLREADRDILSVLPDAAAPHPFDRWALAATYDRVVATRLYNRIVWGTTPADYVGFEQRAGFEHLETADWPGAYHHCLRRSRGSRA